MKLFPRGNQGLIEICPEGRLLHLTFTLRAAGSLIRVISARDMLRKERTIYEQAD